MRSLVDIAGYLPFFATFSVTTQEAAAFGAFSFVPIMEQRPDSLHVFFPVDMDETSHESGVFEFFCTTDFFTVKPGRAINCKGATEVFSTTDIDDAGTSGAPSANPVVVVAVPAP